MNYMTLGAYTFVKNPSSVSDLMTPIRRAAGVDTFTRHAVFSWGSTVAGKEIELHWVLCSLLQYAQFQTFLTADASLTFDPKDGSGKKYTVEIMGLRGEYWIKLGSGYRQNVVLTLRILREVS